MNKKLSMFFAIITILFMVSGIATVVANNVTLPSVTATPGNSNIFYVSAVGLHVNETVSLALMDEGNVTYLFVEEIETNEEGNFINILVVVPTSISGNLTLQANTTITFEEQVVDEEGNLLFYEGGVPIMVNATETLSAEVEYTVPSLVGEQGEAGEDGMVGEQGPTGLTGPQGPEADIVKPLIISVIGVVVAVAVAIIALHKK